MLLFTGGSLLVGAVGRTDLLGAEHARPYAEQMFHSLHDRILAHQDFVGVFPTHGAGSLCSTGIGSTLNSTIGFERRYNPLLQPAEVDPKLGVAPAGRLADLAAAGARATFGVSSPTLMALRDAGSANL